MKTALTTFTVALTGVLGTPAPEASADEMFARATERAPQQVAALIRGIAVGNGWQLLDEAPINDSKVIGLQLCQDAGENERAMVCGQFAILDRGAASEIVLLHVRTALPLMADEHNLSDATKGFLAVLDAVSAPQGAPEDGRFRCDANGCP